MENKKKLALISVSDKTKIEVISNFLIKNDFDIISTGGTLKALWDMKIPAKSVEEVTEFPEIMDGRVKTLHPNIHAGILARNKDLDILDNHNIKKIDVLIVNFYPFEKEVLCSVVKVKEILRCKMLCRLFS